MATGSLVSTALQLLAAEFLTGHPVSALAANLSGITVAGSALAPRSQSQ